MLTTSWSSDQLPIVRFISQAIACELAQSEANRIENPTPEMVRLMADDVYRQVNTFGPHLKTLDQRPKETYSPQKPDVFLHYTIQGLLEDIIVECRKAGLQEIFLKEFESMV